MTQDEWVFSDLSIKNGSTLKLYPKKEKIPEYLVYVKFKKEFVKLYETKLTGYGSQAFVLELRIKLADELGFPLSIFRLKTMNNVELFDDNKLSYYDLNNKNGKNETLVLETWRDWDTFLFYSIKGYQKQVMNSINSDEAIKQYQIRCALFIACSYGNFELAKTLMFLGEYFFLNAKLSIWLIYVLLF
jgi:hypothetical protein